MDFSHGFWDHIKIIPVNRCCFYKLYNFYPLEIDDYLFRTYIYTSIIKTLICEDLIYI